MQVKDQQPGKPTIIPTSVRLESILGKLIKERGDEIVSGRGSADPFVQLDSGLAYLFEPGSDKYFTCLGLIFHTRPDSPVSELYRSRFNYRFRKYRRMYKEAEDSGRV